MSLRENLLSSAKPRMELITEPENFASQYGSVYVRELSGHEREAVEKVLDQDKKAFENAGWRGRMAAMYLCEADGTRPFTLDDAEELNGLSMHFLDAVIVAGHKLSGIGVKALEEAKGNSEADQA